MCHALTLCLLILGENFVMDLISFIHTASENCKIKSLTNISFSTVYEFMIVLSF